MEQTPIESRPAIKYDVIVQDDGRILLYVPFSPGKRVTVFVVEEQTVDDPFDDLLHAAHTSTDFWDNPYDDEDWNAA